MLARFYTSSGDAQAQTRCVVPARVLPAQVMEPMHAAPAKGLPSLWQNPCSQWQLDAIATDHGDGKRIVIDVDDDYGSTHENYGFEPARFHMRALEWCHAVTCTNEALAAIYRERVEEVHVIPSCVDEADWDFGRQYQHLDGKLRIGYAAGRTHAPDAALLGEALKDAAKRDDVIVEFIGAFDPGWDFPYVRYPALSYPAYKATVNTWSIGLAPLVESSLNATRSDLKALDYAICGAVVIASDVGPYRHLIERELICSADSPAEWAEALEILIEDDERRVQIARNAFTYCRVERHPANQRVAYLDALGLTRSCTHA